MNAICSYNKEEINPDCSLSKSPDFDRRITPQFRNYKFSGRNHLKIVNHPNKPSYDPIYACLA